MSKKKIDERISLSNKDFEFLGININGQDIPPGNVGEILLPDARMNCFAMQGTFYGKHTLIYATGAVKITAILRSELENKGEEKKEEKKGG